MYRHKFHIRNIKISYRLLIAFCGLVLLVVLISSLSQFYWYARDTKAKIGDYAIDNLTQITISIENSLNRMDDYYLEIADGATVQSALSDKPEKDSIADINNQFRFHQTIVQRYSYFKYIKNIYVLSTDLTPVLSYTNIYQDSNLDQEEIKRIAESDKDTFGERRWKALPGEAADSKEGKKKKESLVLHSLIYPMWGKGVAGYMVAEIRPAFFEDMFSQPQSVNGIETYLLDRDGVVMSSFDSEKLPIGRKHFDPEIMDKIKTNSQYFHYRNENQSGMLAYVPIEHTTLYAVSMIPDTYFIEASHRIKKFIMVSGLIFLLLSGFFTIVITRSIHIPLKQLTVEMDKVRMGNFNVSIEDTYCDEISEIKHNFSYMVREVERLTQGIRLHERQVKKAEMSALQAQINPHFLSNTLGSIQWMAELQGAENIKDITGSLINLLHMCAQKGKSQITMQEELEYLNCYINVQKYRYLDKFQVFFNFEEDIYDIEVPQFILQPVIENAIIHGIGPMAGQGNITITCQKGERLRIEILDNGMGMSKDMISGIFDRRSEGRSNFNNIGINNIRERLELYYNKDFLFTIESREGEFTKVIIELPFTKENMEG